MKLEYQNVSLQKVLKTIGCEKAAILFILLLQINSLLEDLCSDFLYNDSPQFWYKMSTQWNILAFKKAKAISAELPEMEKHMSLQAMLV